MSKKKLKKVKDEPFDKVTLNLTALLDKETGAIVSVQGGHTAQFMIQFMTVLSDYVAQFTVEKAYQHQPKKPRKAKRLIKQFFKEFQKTTLSMAFDKLDAKIKAEVLAQLNQAEQPKRGEVQA